MPAKPNLYIEGNIDALNLELKYIDLNLRAIMLEADVLYENYLAGQTSPILVINKYKRLVFAVIALKRFEETEIDDLKMRLLTLRQCLDDDGLILDIHQFNSELEGFIGEWYKLVAKYHLVARPPDEDVFASEEY